MPKLKQLEVPIAGMDCAECTQHVRHAIAQLPGVESVSVLLASEKAMIQLDPSRVDLPMIRKAVAEAGYAVATDDKGRKTNDEKQIDSFRLPSSVLRHTGIVLVVVFGFVLFVVVIGEWLGLLERINESVPLVVGGSFVLGLGLPIFRNVLRAAMRRQIISHTLMSLGVLAALAVGQWVTALVVLFFMYVGDYVENFTTNRARRAVRDLTALMPRMARVEQNGQEQEVEIGELETGDVVVVRPGEQIPVDGEVVEGQATVNQAALTGEAMPIDVSAGSHVLAATIAQLGSLRVRTTAIGADTTFGRVIKLVEEAEANRAEVQRFADKFSGYYLPVVASWAALTFLIRGDPLATAAVLVVACSCSIALATPIAMLASIGNAARRGILIKGGKYLEALARADVLLIDKTGTLTLGQPRLTDVIPLNGMNEDELLRFAASAEHDSEHPLAQAVRDAARGRGMQLHKARAFEAVPGLGVRAEVGIWRLEIGNARMVPEAVEWQDAKRLEQDGKTVLFVAGHKEQSARQELIGVLAAADTLRPEVSQALQAVRALGIKQIEILTGDHERAALSLSKELGVAYRANLLPADKIKIVRDYQAQGRHVVMVGDGVNDAPALAQADVGIAMAATGTAIAAEAAHIALMRDDWSLVVEAIRLAQRTMRVVKMNLVFTGVYNLIGLSLAAVGILPPMLAAAAQSLPDLGILANSSRLLKD